MKNLKNLLLLGCIDSLEEKYQYAYSFIKDFCLLIEELLVDIEAIRRLEKICKNQGTTNGQALYARTISSGM